MVPTSLVTIAGLAVVARGTLDVGRTSAIALPALAIGLVVGAWPRYRVREDLFRS